MYLLTLTEDIFFFVSGLGLLQGYLLAALIYFHPKGDRSVNKFLAFYIACLSIVMSGPLLLKMIGWKDSFFVAAFPSLCGPLMYFYIRSFKETITWRKVWPHLLLFVAYFFASYWWVSWLSNTYPAEKDFPEQAFRSPVGYVFFGARYVQLILYYFLSKRQLMTYQRSINQLFSETSQINLNWIKWLINGYLLIILTSVVIFSLMVKFPANFYLLYLINIAFAAPYIYMATYKGITQPTIWQKQQAESKKELEREILDSEEIANTRIRHQVRGEKQVINDSRVGDIIAKVILVMDNEKLYQEPELTLQHLSARLQYPSHQVSQAINEGMNKSFYDLINGYRVDEAKRLLLDSKNRNYTILSIGFEAGFNSKTTFNTVFKKFTNLTPTEFRDKERQSAHSA